MKNIILFALFAVSVTMVMAQINPKSGIIITNSGDTIRGVIDFRTNEKLSKECEFWAEGKSEGKTYKPGDIEGFRFDDNGKYFVTRKLNVDGKPRLYFAEFMVKGMMNLYCVVESSDEHFFFEREDGEMAKLTSRAFHSTSTLQEVQDKMLEKKEQYGKVKYLLRDSWTAINDMSQTSLSQTNISRAGLVNVVRDYHKDVCTDGSTCMVYEYDEKSDKEKCYFKFFTGFAYYSREKSCLEYLPSKSYTGCAFDFGIGVELNIGRTLKGGSVELGLSYSPKNSFEHDVVVSKGQEPSQTRYEKKSSTVISLGLVKSFGNGKILPLVRGGAIGVYDRGNREVCYYKSRKKLDFSWGNTWYYGGYLGVGAQMAVGKHFARLHADLYADAHTMTKWGITAELGL